MSHSNDYRSALERRLGDFSAAAQYAAGEVKTAPRITPEDIEAEIVSESYFTAADGVRYAPAMQEAVSRVLNTLIVDGQTGEQLRSAIAGRVMDVAKPTCVFPGEVQDLGLLTFCVLILRNGTKVVGINYGPVCPENFNPVQGREEARKAAVEQIWPLLGYELRSKLSRTDPDYRMLLKEIPMSVIADFVDDNDVIKGMISPAKAD